MADTHEARQRKVEARRSKASWVLGPMVKSGYAPKKAELAKWVIEGCDDVLSLAAENAALREKVEAVEAIAALGGWESSYSLLDAYRRLAEHRREEFARMGKDEDARECERLRDVLRAALAAVSASSTTEKPDEPIRCQAWCSQWPDCQHDWRKWHSVIASRK